MTAPQGICSYAGMPGTLSASFTLAHGVVPSVATLLVAPRLSRVPERGPLVFNYGGTRIAFPACRLESLASEFDGEGREIWRLAAADRRWKWRNAGRISGQYNVRKSGSRNAIIARTEKSPRELARLCLAALGERRFDVSRLPNDARPVIDWDYAFPAAALASLCGQLGARVVLGIDNSISLEPLGSCQAHMLTTDALELAQPTRPRRQENMVLVCGRTRWQHDFLLEAVGFETDGSLVPIAELSYTPAGSASSRDWRHADVPHFQCVSNTAARGLARESVFRYYRIATPFSLPAVRGQRIEVDRLDRVLPLEASLLQGSEDSSGEPARQRPLVYGVFHGGGEDTRSDRATARPNTESEPRGIYTGAFSVDLRRGLVIFAEPVFRYFDTGPSSAERNLIAPAELYLRVALSLRDENGGWLRHEVARGRSGCRWRPPIRYVRDEKLALHVIENQTPPRAGRVIDNRLEVEAAARQRLDVLAREKNVVHAAHVVYAGLKPIDVDGLVSQVTWTISPEGFATTRAAYTI